MRLEVRQGCFQYEKSQRQVLKDISFSADTGQVLAILGPNGAGKTTLLRCMMGLLSWDSGQTCLDGRALGDIPRRQLWRQISYVPQAKQALAAYTVEEMVLLGRTAALGRFSLPGQADMKKAAEVLERLDLTGIRSRSCSQLSGGEFQMVLIARALASEPSILVLDEPESNLDFRNQLLVLDTISSLASEGITCVFNTHYPAHALRRADQALMLGKDGRSAFGPVGEIVTERNISEFFGVQSVIGMVETPGNIIRDVIPLSIGGEAAPPRDMTRRVIAGITIIMTEGKQAERVNSLLHAHNGDLIGRMGLPYRKAGIYILNLTLDAPLGEVMALTDQLSRIPGVSAKTTYASEAKRHEA